MNTDTPAVPYLREDAISDLRAYEKERPEFQRHVLALRRRRRVPLGPILTAAFENRDTIRYQIQEMLRVERSIHPDAVEAELEAYNPLLPSQRELSATLFVEVTDPAKVREWLTRLAGLEQHLVLELADGRQLRARPEAGHARSLTRDDVTSAVHYLRIPVPTDAEISQGAFLVVDHPEYAARVPLTAETLAELAIDLAT